jgi:hypothetical protein
VFATAAAAVLQWAPGVLSGMTWQAATLTLLLLLLLLFLVLQWAAGVLWGMTWQAATLTA